MKTLGITGSSGSGKSTVSELFLKFDDTAVFDADKVAKSMDYPNSEYLKELNAIFSESIIKQSGYLDRKKLAILIETNEEIRKKVNEITRKFMIVFLKKFIDDNKNKKLLVFDIPILFENKFEDTFDKILVVISEKDEQLKRICTRDKISIENAEKRLNMQKNNDYYISKADFVINNINKTKEELNEEINSIYEKLIG